MSKERGAIPVFDSKDIQPKGKNWLLVIGIDKYADPNVPTLINAVRDTERLTQILIENYGFQLFSTPLTDEKATRHAILETIERLEKVLKEEDNLIVFFSGHGYRKSKTGFIVPSDGRNDSTANYIEFASLNVRIDELPMRHFLLILDCCFAGVALKNLGEKRELGKPSRRVLAASGSDETAEDGFYGRNSPFTAALAEILEDNKGVELPVKNLYVQLRDLMDAKGVRQVPIEGSWKMESNRDGEFIFLKHNAEQEAWQNTDKTRKVALQTFIEKHPLSNFAAEARVLIQHIEAQEAETKRLAEIKRKADAEKQAYEHAKHSRTVSALSKFLRDNPSSLYVDEIVKLLAEVEEEAAWKEAKNKNTLSAFLNFKNVYGGGRFADDCQQRIEAFYKRLEETENAEAAKAVEKQRQEAELEQKRQAEARKQKEAEAAKAEQERQRKIREQEDARLRYDTEIERNERAEKKRLEQLKKDKEKEEKEWLERAEAEHIRQERLTKEAADKKAKEEKSKAQIRDNQSAEPSFFQKFKMPLMGGGGLLVAFLIWLGVPKTIPFSEPEMVQVQGGSFKMGSNEEDNEKPIHKVTVSNFSIGKYEVTQKQWRDVMGSDPRELNFKGCDQCPVESVSWDDIQEFLKKLNAKIGKTYRLPTEAEWEFAARGGNKSGGFKYSGSETVGNVAWLSYNAGSETHPVGQKQANELGLYDMSGNVWEWCSDWFKGYSGSSGVNDYTGSYRVSRGGSWYYDSEYCRVTGRYGYTPTYQYDNLGFRLAFSPPQ